MRVYLACLDCDFTTESWRGNYLNFFLAHYRHDGASKVHHDNKHHGHLYPVLVLDGAE